LRVAGRPAAPFHQTFKEASLLALFARTLLSGVAGILALVMRALGIDKALKLTARSRKMPLQPVH
jgi:hypothetical protein